MKKKLPKYQIAGTAPRGIFDDVVQGYNPSNDKSYLDQKQIPSNASPLDLQEVRRKTVMNWDVSPTFQALNAIALGTGAIANTINEYKTRTDERRKYITSLQQPYNIQNPVQNDAPIYTKYGGSLMKYEDGGQIPKNNVRYISIPTGDTNTLQSTVTVDLASKQKIQRGDKGTINIYNAKDKAGNSITITEDQISPYLNSNLHNNYAIQNILPNGKQGQTDSLYVAPGASKFDINIPSNKFGGDLAKYPFGGGPLTSEGAKEILHDGTIHGKPITDKQKKYFGYIAGGGKPQAKYGIKHKKHMRSIMDPDGDGDNDRDSRRDMDHDMFEYGGGTGVEINPEHKGELTRKAKSAGMSPLEFASHVLANKENYSSDTIKQANFAHNFNKQYGGDLPETSGLPNRKGATIEAEGGEVYQQPDGNIIKINDNAPSHEQGGVPINNVERVLEDTSTSRKDEDSKSLRLTPTNVNLMFGVKPKRSLSHSETLEFVNDKLQKDQKVAYRKFNQTLEILDQNSNDKYASNSLDMNSEYISKLPNKKDVFETLFNNQEKIKNDMNIQNGKAKYGKYIPKALYGVEDPITLTKPDIGGGRTPTGRNNNNYNFTAAQLEAMAKQHGLRYDTNKNFQADLYDKVLSLPNGQQIVNNMWDNYGNTNQGKSIKQNRTKEAFADGSPKARTMFLAGELLKNRQPEQTISTDPNKPTINPAPQTFGDDTPIDINTGDQPQSTSSFNLKPTVPSKFNEPLHWYDTAAETLGLLENDRTPTVLNPVQLHHVTPKLLNPLPALQAGQRDFNAVTDKLPSTGAGMSNATNAFAQKYSIDNQVLGQYDNNNNQIENQSRYYNAGIDDKQSEMDAQSREQFERKQLGSIEAQRQQKLTLLDSIFTKIAQNNALNRNGNLIQQLAPQYDQYGVKNDNKYTFSTGATPSTGAGLQFIYDQSGRKFRVMTDAKGKQVIVPDTKIAK